MNCPGCLKEQEMMEYCVNCRRALFDGSKISPRLPFGSPYEDDAAIFREYTTRLSISGVQIKYSLKKEKLKLVLTDRGGEYILKPIPMGQFDRLDQVPANEHLTMQLARQVFKLNVPANGLVFFRDGSPGYIVRRFDRHKEGSKIQQEDFAQLARMTAETHRESYKYQLSYEEMAQLMKKYLPAYRIELEKFFRIILFNYLVSNGDAHLKNFSVTMTPQGDYVLSPVYDLLCTRLYTNDLDMALSLFAGEYIPATYSQLRYFTKPDFQEFAIRIGISERRVFRLLDELSGIDRVRIYSLIRQSYLNEASKKLYREYFDERMAKLGG